MVTIISCDMRFWTAPEKADILVSMYRFWQLLGIPTLYSSSNSRLPLFFRLVNCWVLLGTMSSLQSVLMEPKGF